ncbi:four helix bundle protein [Endomicrobium proavitum]|uniref:23S ribosomal protein n=1 Tax=Endomicrobium proavitum TaxID=1408281 RepID=A0A0G3WIJ7_9BACT|nr:four helix bundle protein [Endomicrobium proavitum]AKL97715.1 23S ribosomal protein [Endomicrobium proavitum]
MYKNLEIWKESVDLIKRIYKIAASLPKEEDYNIKSQLRRAVISVALNIAEGKCRHSAKDFAHFLNLSVSSLNEVNAILNICEELEFLKNIDEIYNKINILSRRISALRTKLLKLK